MLGCFIDVFRPTEVEEPLFDFKPLPLMFTKGCGAFSWPGEGPVDRMKSAKSRIDSDSMRGSRASGRVITFLLGEGLWLGTPGTLLALLLALAGSAFAPNELSLSASTRGYTITEAVLGRSGSAFRTTGDSYYRQHD
jgi:hypothetical protein